MKVGRCIEVAQEALRRNKCVVIGLQSTGESNVGQAMADAATQGEEMDDFVSAPAVILRNLIANSSL